MQTQSIAANNNQKKESFLRHALQGNALFSLLTGTAFILAAESIARFIGEEIPNIIVFVIGLGLLPFGYMVYRLTAQTAVSPKAARSVTIMDVCWVIGSIVLLAVGWSLFTTAGRWFIGLQAEAVATFALLQIIGLRRLQK